MSVEKVREESGREPGQDLPIDQASRPRLIDFGMARMRHAGGNDLEPSGGTPASMAPEQAWGEADRIGPRSEVFALGAVLYDRLVGSPPFAAQDFRKALHRAARCDFDRDALTRGVEVPSGLARICLRAMEAWPDDRYDTADGLVDDLERFARPPRRTALLSARTAVLLLGGTAAGWWLARGRGTHPGSGTPPFSVASVPGPLALQPLRVVSMAVQRDRYDVEARRSEHFGAIGDAQSEASLGDEVRVEAELSEPACCSLVAFNPDGRRQLCDPPNPAGKADETVRPAPTLTVRYPRRERSYFRLSDGRGEQVFVRFASRMPLPPFAEWRSRLDAASWPIARQSGEWAFVEGELRPASRDAGGRRGQEVDHAPAPLEALRGFLEEKTGVDPIRAVAFPVE